MKHALALKKRLGMPAKSFVTIDVPSGTDPVADNPSDTLTLAALGPLTISGDASTDTITFTATGPTFGFTTIATTSGTNPVADAAADTLTLSAGTGISVTGNETTDTVTFAVTATLAQILTNGSQVNSGQAITWDTTGATTGKISFTAAADALNITTSAVGPTIYVDVTTFFGVLAQMDTDKEFRFRSSANRVYSPSSNVLTVEAGTTLNLTASSVVTSAALTVGTTTTFNSLTYTWPGSIGSGTRILSSNSSGTLSWVNPFGIANTWTAKQTFNGNIQVGSSGATITDILSATATLDFPSTSANSSSDLTITVTGAAVGNSVFLGVPNSAISSGTNMGNCAFWAWVSATNTVTVRFVNNDASAADPASATFRVVVVKI